jgi:hypothetical protein
MKKIVLTYGLIAGAITGVMLFVTGIMFNNGSLKMENGHYVGYTTMVIALSLVFFAVRNYRENHLGGVISFGKAFKVAFLVTLVAAVVYALSWEICYHTVAKGFSEMFSESYVKSVRDSGADEQAIQKAQTEMAEFIEIYKNPLVRFGMTVLEILPVGLIMSLLSAIILRKKTS